MNEQPPKCHYKHHDETGRPMPKCTVHPDTYVTCGPFRHVCLKCEPFWAAPCGKCGVPRVSCCC